jgi:tryptophan synthase beta subunit
MVAVNKQQDMVHRSVGRAGVVLVGEGSNAVRSLLNDEVKKTERYVPGVPITTFIVGSGEDQIALPKLQRKMKRLPKKLSKAQMREVRNRLKAVGGFNMPIPKGPMPKSLRVPKV